MGLSSPRTFWGSAARSRRPLARRGSPVCAARRKPSPTPLRRSRSRRHSDARRCDVRAAPDARRRDVRAGHRAAGRRAANANANANANKKTKPAKLDGAELPALKKPYPGAQRLGLRGGPRPASQNASADGRRTADCAATQGRPGDDKPFRSGRRPRRRSKADAICRGGWRLGANAG